MRLAAAGHAIVIRPGQLTDFRWITDRFQLLDLVDSQSEPATIDERTAGLECPRERGQDQTHRFRELSKEPLRLGI